MVLEVAMLDVRQGEEKAFETAFTTALPLISSIKGFISLDLERCIERASRYVLLVKWERLEDHTVGFRQSPVYEEWKRLLHHFYDPFPTVEHFTAVMSTDTPRQSSS